MRRNRRSLSFLLLVAAHLTLPILAHGGGATSQERMFYLGRCANGQACNFTCDDNGPVCDSTCPISGFGSGDVTCSDGSTCALATNMTIQGRVTFAGDAEPCGFNGAVFTIGFAGATAGGSTFVLPDFQLDNCNRSYECGSNADSTCPLVRETVFQCSTDDFLGENRPPTATELLSQPLLEPIASKLQTMFPGQGTPIVTAAAAEPNGTGYCVTISFVTTGRSLRTADLGFVTELTTSSVGGFGNCPGGGGGPELAQCRADLAAAQTAFDTCVDSLADARAALKDTDDDGILDPTDDCADTPAATAVDPSGCSRKQFCQAFNANSLGGRADCRRSDWRNDEPSVRPRDCAVVPGPQPAERLCEPAP